MVSGFCITFLLSELIELLDVITKQQLTENKAKQFSNLQSQQNNFKESELKPARSAIKIQSSKFSTVKEEEEDDDEEN